MPLESVTHLVSNPAGTVTGVDTGPVQHRLARIARRAQRALGHVGGLVNPSARTGTAGVIDHRVAGAAERLLARRAGAANSDPAGYVRGQLAGASADIACHVRNPPARRLDALVLRQAVHDIGIAGDEPSRADAH